MPRSPTPNSSWIGVIMPADDVLVDLVDEDDEAEHPHRLGEEPDEERASCGRATGSPAGSSGVGDAMSGVSPPVTAAGAPASSSVSRSRAGESAMAGDSARWVRSPGHPAAGWSGRARERHARRRGADRPRRGAGPRGASRWRPSAAAPAPAGADPHRATPCRPRSTGPTSPARTRRGSSPCSRRPPAARAPGVWERAQPLESDAGRGAGARAHARPGAARPLRDRRGAGHARGRRRGRGGRQLRRTGDGHRPVGGGRRGPRAGHAPRRSADHDLAARELASAQLLRAWSSEAGVHRRVGAEAPRSPRRGRREALPLAELLDGGATLAAERDEAVHLGPVDRLVLEQRPGHEVEPERGAR